MATFHDRTLAPKIQGRLLRAAGRACAMLTSAEVVCLTAAACALPTSALFSARRPTLSDALARRAAVFGPLTHDAEGF